MLFFEDGVIYMSMFYGMVVVIDLVMGKMCWKYDFEIWKGWCFGNFGFNYKGVVYWSDGEYVCILFGINMVYVYLFDVFIGEFVGSFVDGGVFDFVLYYCWLIKCCDLMFNFLVFIVGDLIIQVGLINDCFNNKEMVFGDVYVFDVLIGEFVWMFYNLLFEGEFGYDIWEDGLVDYIGNINVWMYMFYDEEFGLFYLLFGILMNDFYGGQCKGKNFFVESFVCFEVKMGKFVWYFQSMYYGVWDWDFFVLLNFVDVMVDGKKV